jgi:adenine phosphoribosyltransferase
MSACTASTMNPDELKATIREIPDFPSKGVSFKDITTLLKDARALRSAVELIAADVRGRGIVPQIIVAPEARGFILGGALAYVLGAGLVLVRKSGKLPAECVSGQYQLEYGTDVIQMHKDAIGKGQRVLIVDDLLATGGTIGATAALVEKLGGTVAGMAFLIELTYLNGRRALEGKGYAVSSIIKY